MSHSLINPTILYWGTPVVLITTVNEDGSYNIAPMSSAWWLGSSCMLGLLALSQTTKNLIRTGQCVLNLPSDDLTDHVNALARTTGTSDVPDFKIMLGYSYVKDKFAAAKLHPQASEVVDPPRIQECPVQMEARVSQVHEFQSSTQSPEGGSLLKSIEVQVVRTYVTDDVRMVGHENRVDPDKWLPMIMSFQNLYGLRDRAGMTSKLAQIDEKHYRMPVDE
ncbi:hypothetical protein F5Y16DRAFT_421213 [Xylariaceae sp. FL0255]|nr:hypothetical protein F5Y16DRAFT_421213 [Xylariaceae sp. FL0255]